MHPSFRYVQTLCVFSDQSWSQLFYDTTHTLLGYVIEWRDSSAFSLTLVFYRNVHIQSLGVFHAQIWYDFANYRWLRKVYRNEGTVFSLPFFDGTLHWQNICVSPCRVANRSCNNFSLFSLHGLHVNGSLIHFVGKKNRYIRNTCTL